jgi:hypothetical protein
MAFEMKTTQILDCQYTHPKHFVVVGSGGNGAYFIRDFIRQVSLENKRREIEFGGRSRNHSITLIDADEVELKNLNRQNFVAGDVGKNKAQVIADRYGRAFGMPVQFVPEYVSDWKELRTIAKSREGFPVFIGAVDNNKTRMIIHEAFKDFRTAFWIDAGNEEFAGQVVCGYKGKGTFQERHASIPQSFRIPCVVDLHPEIGLATDKLPGEMSCAERSVSSPQNIITNLTAANIMMGFANTIMTAKADNGDGLRTHAVYFNTKNMMSFTTRHNHADNMTALYVPVPVEETAPVGQDGVVIDSTEAMSEAAVQEILGDAEIEAVDSSDVEEYDIPLEDAPQDAPF